MNDADDLRLTVLSALIAQYGPIPCVNIVLIPQRTALATSPRSWTHSMLYRVEASQLIRQDNGTVTLVQCPFVKLPEPTKFHHIGKAIKRRNLICRLLVRLPMQRTDSADPLDLYDADIVLSRIQTGPDGVKILLPDASEIPAKERN